MAIKEKLIDTGLIEFKLPFDRGVEKIKFNPNDPEFFIRLADGIEKISSLYDTLADDFEKETDSLGKLQIIKDLNDKIKAEFDKAFGNKVSEVIFKYVSPNGIIKSQSQYYSFYILDYLMPIIAEETSQTAQGATASLEKAMKKHTVKYAHKFK